MSHINRTRMEKAPTITNALMEKMDLPIDQVIALRGQLATLVQNIAA